jgi:hypothetical protein
VSHSNVHGVISKEKRTSETHIIYLFDLFTAFLLFCVEIQDGQTKTTHVIRTASTE